MPSIKHYRIRYYTKIGGKLLDEVTIEDGALVSITAQAVMDNGFGVITTAVYTDGNEVEWGSCTNMEV